VPRRRLQWPLQVRWIRDFSEPLLYIRFVDCGILVALCGGCSLPGVPTRGRSGSATRYRASSADGCRTSRDGDQRPAACCGNRWSCTARLRSTETQGDRAAGTYRIETRVCGESPASEAFGRRSQRGRLRSSVDINALTAVTCLLSVRPSKVSSRQRSNDGNPGVLGSPTPATLEVLQPNTRSSMASRVVPLRPAAVHLDAPVREPRHDFERALLCISLRSSKLAP
jgi:hypothetical protein